MRAQSCARAVPGTWLARLGMDGDGEQLAVDVERGRQILDEQAKTVPVSGAVQRF